MLGMGKGKTLLAAFVGAVAVGALLPASANATASGFADCAPGPFCAWSGDNGTGARCEWQVDDADWLAGSRVCI